MDGGRLPMAFPPRLVRLRSLGDSVIHTNDTFTSQLLAISARDGTELSAILERPTGPQKGTLVACHCFTCSKNIKVLVRLCRSLAARGWNCLRFDARGIGQSGGDFASSDFDSACRDLEDIAKWLADQGLPADFVFGHSFGGLVGTLTAWESTALPARGVITLASPSTPARLAGTLDRLSGDIATAGRGQVAIGVGRFWVDRTMTENFRSIDYPGRLTAARPTSSVRSHLLIHSLVDETVPYEHVERWLELLRSAGLTDVSHYTLPAANHLITMDPRTVEEIVDLIDHWCTARKT